MYTDFAIEIKIVSKILLSVKLKECREVRVSFMSESISSRSSIYSSFSKNNFNRYEFSPFHYVYKCLNPCKGVR